MCNRFTDDRTCVYLRMVERVTGLRMVERVTGLRMVECVTGLRMIERVYVYGW